MHYRVDPRRRKEIKRHAEKQAPQRRFPQTSFERSENEYGKSNPAQQRQIEIGKGKREQDTGGKREQNPPFP